MKTNKKSKQEYIVIPKKDWEFLKNCIDYDGLQPDRRASLPSDIANWWGILGKSHKIIEG